MAGKPRTKARREAEARSGKRVDRAARVAILQRAEEIGSRAAAAEVGVSMATLRTWRRRLKAEAERASVSLSAESDGAPPTTRAEGLRARAEKAREASSRALDQADALLARGLASEARNASVVCGVHGDRARELEEAARAEESHEVTLTEARARLVLTVIERGYDDLGLPVPRAFLQALLRGWPGKVDAEVIEQAREEVRRSVRAEVRAEMIAEEERARRTRPALPAGEDEPPTDEVVDGELVGDGEAAIEPTLTLEEVRPEFLERYPVQPELAIEAELHARRLDGAGGYGVLRRSRPDLTHPMLRGGL